MDFELRPWVPYSGWPLTPSELEPWYTRAQVVCEAGPFDYDLERWRRRTGMRADALDLGDRILTQLAQLSPPTRFARRYRDELDASTNVGVYLHANATEIVTDTDGSTAKSVRATTLDGQRVSVACRCVILAAGGIENARLLLASRGVSAGGLGNDNDLVGRFFMDHPRLEIGSVDFGSGGCPDLYDPVLRWRKRNRASRGVYDPSLIAAGLTISPEVQRREGILNYGAWIVATFPGEGSAAADALKRLYIGVREHELASTLRDDVMAVVRRPDQAAMTALGRLARPKRLVRSYRLVNIIEPEQMPESRVILSDVLDPLGMPKVRLDWRVGQLVHRTLASAHEILDQDLRRSGLGKLVDPFRVGEHDRFLSSLDWVWHHMGTTRMNADPEGGVVDADCRVHSTSNVYVAGSSVFPTPGNDMPTLTIVALALRLADHLSHRLETPRSDSNAGVSRRSVQRMPLNSVSTGERRPTAKASR